jgi:hypothetical protein
MFDFKMLYCVGDIYIAHIGDLEQFGVLAMVAFPIFIELRCVERSIFDPMVSDLGYLLFKAQGDTALYPQEPPVLENLYR